MTSMLFVALSFIEVYSFSFRNFHIRTFPVWKHERLHAIRNTLPSSTICPRNPLVPVLR